MTDDSRVSNGKEVEEIPWQRLLYEKQSYPDNHVDRHFLSSLSIHVNKHSMIGSNSTINLINMMFESTLIVQQLTVVAVFVALYKHIMNRVMTFKGLITFDLIGLILGYIITHLLSDKKKTGIRRGVQSLAIMGICLRVAAPVLQTLTSSFSDDTIYALGIFFSLTHVIFHDYGNINDVEVTTNVGTVSLSAAMLTAILLASRIKQIETVFGFVLLAVMSFSLFPITSKLVFNRSKALHVSTLFLQWTLASALLLHLRELFPVFIVYQVSCTYGMLLCCAVFVYHFCPDSNVKIYIISLCLCHGVQILVVLVLFVGPIGLMRMQRNKKNFSGPWDIARL